MHRCNILSLLFFLFFFTHILTHSQCMWKLMLRWRTTTRIHTSTWNPFSQSNWQCFHGTPSWAIYGALIRANNRASHRKPPGITHGSWKPQDMIDGWITEPSSHTHRGRQAKESGKERVTGRRLEAQRRKWKRGCRWRRCEEEDSVMQGEILLYVGGHSEDKMIRRMPQLLQHLWKVRADWGEETEDLHQSRGQMAGLLSKCHSTQSFDRANVTAREKYSLYMYKWRMNPCPL